MMVLKRGLTREACAAARASGDPELLAEIAAELTKTAQQLNQHDN
jgi:hypothetical protein